MALSLPVHIVRRELRLAQGWLRKEMAGEDSGRGTAAGSSRTRRQEHESRIFFQEHVNRTGLSSQQLGQMWAH